MTAHHRSSRLPWLAVTLSVKSLCWTETYKTSIRAYLQAGLRLDFDLLLLCAGTLPGKIDLYVGKEAVRKNIPQDSACDELIQLIKDHGRWVEPPKPEEEEAAEGEKAAVVA